MEFWFSRLAEEVCERIEKDKERNKRLPKGLNVHAATESGQSVSRAGPWTSFTDKAKLARQAMALIGNLNEDPSGEVWRPKLINLSISATKFEAEDLTTSSIQKFFTPTTASKSVVMPQQKTLEDEKVKKENFFTQKMKPSTSKSGKEEIKVSEETIRELIPSLESYDESLLECLPATLRRKAIERVDQLKAENEGQSQSEAERSKPIEITSEGTCDSSPQFPISMNKTPKSESVDLDPQQKIYKESRGKKENFFTQKMTPSTSNSGKEKIEVSEETIRELIPSLEAYDESLLECLPATLRRKAIERVDRLKEENEGKSQIEAERSKSIDNEECSKCGQMISPFEMPEHLDYHLAKDLQKEEKATVRTVVMPNNTEKKGRKGSKRKIPDSKKVVSSPDNKKQNIRNFFTVNKN